MKKILTFLSALLLTTTLWATQTVLAPGSSQLASAISDASAGDTLVFQTGTYTESGSSITLGKKLTFMAAKGATPTLVIYAFKINADFEINGINLVNASKDNYLLRTGGNVDGTIAIKNCSFKLNDAVTTPVGYIYLSSNTVGSLLIDNCIFADNTEAQGAILRAQSAKIGTFSMTNCTAYNMPVDHPIFCEGITNGYVDHCTFYNCGIRTVYMKGSTMTNYLVQNCIFMNPAVPESNSYCVATYAGAVKNCMYYNVLAPRSSDATITDCTNADPLFVDAANLDFCLAEGSPAIGAANDTKNLGDLRWVPKDDSRIEVAPGTATLSAAIAAATKPGTTFVLSTGNYIESAGITIDKKITIEAADGEKPVIQMASNFYLKDGGITLKDVKIEGGSDYLISVGGNKAMNIVLQGLEVSNYSKYMINIDAKYHVDSVFIDDCYIHDMKRSVIYGYTNTSENNLPGCNYFKMTNSTVANMGSYSGVAEVFIRNNSNDTELEHEPTVIMDHVTMYNVLASYGAVKTDGGSVTITNCIFDLTASGKAALSLAKSGTVSNTLFYQTTPGAEAAFTDTLLRDPQFVNPAANDLAFKKTSPAIGAASDKSNLGDPRWGVQGDELSFAMAKPAKAEVIYEPSYTLSWSVNDPKGVATILLEYATSTEGPWTTIVDQLPSSQTQYTWDMTGMNYATYYIRGTLSAETPIVSVAAGSVQYKEIVATIYYVTTTGDDSKDGLSWANAKATIQSAINAAKLGDTVKVASGTYAQTIRYKDGVHVFGSYSPSINVQDLEATPSILDGADLQKTVIKKNDNPCTVPTTIDGFIVEKAEHSSDGGGVYLFANCELSNCIIRNCVTDGGGGGGVYNNGGTVRNCTIELCESAGEGGAVCNKAGIVENCIFRGCQGHYATVTNRDEGIVRNCVFYNNTPHEEWPATGGVYNPSGTVCNCTFACNSGALYAGTHSDKVVYNCAFWNNPPDAGSSAEGSVYVNGKGSGYNAADDAFGGDYFPLTLNADNTNPAGPNFVNPTAFVGIPKNDGEIAAMRSADFSLLSTSPLIDAGTNDGAPATDIKGVARPKGSKTDMGAYEYDPDAKPVPVEGVALNVDTLFVQAESTGALAAIFTPKNATNRKVTWWIEADTIATINEYGAVTGIKPGQTRAAVKTDDGNFTDTAIVVVTEKPIIIIHPEVLKFDTLYPMVNYTVPSFIPFWAAKEAARRDSSEANLQAMRDMVPTLVSKENPYCLIANIQGEPTTQMAFTWFTNDGITDGQVQLLAKANATEADFTGTGVITLDATATTTKPLRYATSNSGILKATGMDSKTAYTYVSHKALAKDLTPGTTYSYRVGYNTFWSNIATFETAKEADQGEFSFLLMSDSHIINQEYVTNARACAEAAVKNVPEAKFCLFPGDAEDTGTASNSEWEWEQWFETSMRKALDKMPFVVTDGNHEDTPNLNWDVHYNTDNAFNKSSIIKPQFQGITYSFAYGDVLFIVFSMQDFWRGDHSIDKETSAYLTRDVGNWMKAEVAKHPECKYRVSVCHYNVFSGSSHQEDDEFGPMIRTCMLPVFKECEIDLALQGHDHCYEVMGPVNPDTKTAITSAISGVQTATYNASTNMTAKQGGTFTVDDGTLYFIGATCGRKRYYPHTRAEMDANYSIHKVTNYFDLFTSKFGQPGEPVYTKITVKSDGIYLDSYQVNITTGAVQLYNSIKVVRTKPHTNPAGYEEVQSESAFKIKNAKFIKYGQLLIMRDGVLFNAQGQRVK